MLWLITQKYKMKANHNECEPIDPCADAVIDHTKIQNES